MGFTPELVGQDGNKPNSPGFSGGRRDTVQLPARPDELVEKHLKSLENLDPDQISFLAALLEETTETLL